MGVLVVGKYKIVSGCFGSHEVMWLESVDGLEAAFERMKEIAAQQPGKYFIFSPSTKQSVASIDTTQQSRSLVPPVL